MKRLVQICLVLVVVVYAVSCAPSQAVISTGVYAPPVYVRPIPYGYTHFYYVHPGYRYYHPGFRYHYQRY